MKTIRRNNFGAFLLYIFALLVSCNKPVVYEDSKYTGEEMNGVSRNKVLTIVIPGAVGSIVKVANTPNISSLLPNAVYSWDSYTDSVTTDHASWATLFTGARTTKTAVVGNSYTNNKFEDYPNLFSRLKSSDPGMQISVINSFSSLNDTLIGGQSIDRFVQIQNDLQAKDSALHVIERKESDFILVSFNSINMAGKEGGYSFDSKTYMDAISQTDKYIGELLGALKKRPGYASENWMIVITSTHGGTETGTYGGHSNAERNTFVIYSIPGLTKKEIELPRINVPYSGTFPKFSNNNGEIGLAYSDNPLYKFGADQDFTIEFLIKSTGSSTDNPIMTNKNWASGSNTGWLIYMQSGNIRINYKGADAGRIDIRNGPIVNDNKWHRITIVFNRQGGISMYHNGKFFLQGPTAIKDNGTIDTNYPMVIGDDGTRNYGGNLNSFISDIRVWNSILSEESIEKWAFIPVEKSHPAYDHLIGYWKANDGATGKSAIKDQSPSGIDLTVPNTLYWEHFNDILNPSNLDVSSFVPHSVDYATNVFAWTGIKISPKWDLDGKVYIIK